MIHARRLLLGEVLPIGMVAFSTPTAGKSPYRSRNHFWTSCLNLADLFSCGIGVAVRIGVRSLLTQPHLLARLAFAISAGFMAGCATFGPEIVYPVNAPRIFSDYGSWSSPGGVRPTPHDGVDIEGRRGDRWGGIGAPVLAAADGVVIGSDWSDSVGWRIVIEHGRDEDGAYLRTAYLHHSENLVGVGERIERGQTIAKVGHTGGNSGLHPHLHFTVFRRTRDGEGWTHVDPHPYWYDGPNRITCFDPARQYRKLPIRFTYPVQCK
jgi:murein DD-endopeptidase MepM/ murein hydrolase activator NlpD